MTHPRDIARAKLAELGLSDVIQVRDDGNVHEAAEGVVFVDAVLKLEPRSDAGCQHCNHLEERAMGAESDRDMAVSMLRQQGEDIASLELRAATAEADALRAAKKAKEAAALGISLLDRALRAEARLERELRADVAMLERIQPAFARMAQHIDHLRAGDYVRDMLVAKLAALAPQPEPAHCEVTDLDGFDCGAKLPCPDPDHGEKGE